MPGTKAIFDALNVIYKEREKRSFIVLLQSLLFPLAAIRDGAACPAAIVVMPVVLKLLGVPAAPATGLLSLLRWPVLRELIVFARLASTDTALAEPSRSGAG